MENNRISSIDQFRGVAILAMVLGHYMTGLKTIPAWLKRSSDIGLTVIDLGAPLFIFAIGLTFGLSFAHQASLHGYLKTYSNFFKRYLAIFGAGALMCALEGLFSETAPRNNWSILETIGIAGLLTLAAIRLPARRRTLAGILLLVIYQLLLDRFLLERTVSWPLGGPIGSLSWAGMLILATVFADLYHEHSQGSNPVWPASLLALGAGLALSFMLAVSEHRVSLSYVLIGLGVSGLIFALVDLLERGQRLESHALTVCGRNAFVLFILHYALIGIFFLPGIPVLYAAAPLWLAFIEAALVEMGVIAIAVWLDRKNIYITL